MVEYLPPNWINAFRFIVAALLMIPLFPRRLFHLKRPEIWSGLLLGFFLFGTVLLNEIRSSAEDIAEEASVG